MSIRKCKRQGIHGQNRLRQRSNIKDDKNIKAFIRSASMHGFNPCDFPEDGQLYIYINNKERARHKRIKVYKGFVFVFNRTSNRLITAYRLPEELTTEFEEFIKHKLYPNTKH